MTAVLVLDDEVADRQHLASVLIDAGYTVLEASTSDEALALARAEQPALVIADVLSSLSGQEFMLELRTEQATSSIPVIFSAATQGREEARRLRDVRRLARSDQALGARADHDCHHGGTRCGARAAPVRTRNRRIPAPPRDASVRCADRHRVHGHGLPHSPHEQETDLAAATRDEAAAQHDRELAARDAALSDEGGAAIRRRAALNRKREQAARDRLEARADREALLRLLAISETDGLTGARARSPGLADLSREIGRARRAAGRLAIAYVDVVGLRAVNDTRGHAAGDAMLQRVVRAIRPGLRSYDPVVRLGGDDFLCIDGATELIARTDADMPRSSG